jgi:hypothetical protein
VARIATRGGCSERGGRDAMPLSCPLAPPSCLRLTDNSTPVYGRFWRSRWSARHFMPGSRCGMLKMIFLAVPVSLVYEAPVHHKEARKRA